MGTLAAAAADDGRDLYSGLVQVFPVLLLALVWESGFVAKLATEDHRRRSAARPQGVRFWTKSRVRVFSLTVTSTVVTEIALCALVLADAISASAVTRTLVLAGLLLALGTLLTRIGVDVWEATRSERLSPTSTASVKPSQGVETDAPGLEPGRG